MLSSFIQGSVFFRFGNSGDSYNNSFDIPKPNPQRGSVEFTPVNNSFNNNVLNINSGKNTLPPSRKDPHSTFNWNQSSQGLSSNASQLNTVNLEVRYYLLPQIIGRSAATSHDENSPNNDSGYEIPNSQKYLKVNPPQAHPSITKKPEKNNNEDTSKVQLPFPPKKRGFKAFLEKARRYVYKTLIGPDYSVRLDDFESRCAKEIKEEGKRERPIKGITHTKNTISSVEKDVIIIKDGVQDNNGKAIPIIERKKAKPGTLVLRGGILVRQEMGVDGKITEFSYLASEEKNGVQVYEDFFANKKELPASGSSKKGEQ